MDDLISRQAAIEHLKKRLYETALNNDTEHPYYEEMADNRVSVWLEELPSIDPVKHGKWKEIDLANYKALCSQCGTWSPIMGRFCPNCGAKMERSESCGT